MSVTYLQISLTSDGLRVRKTSHMISKSTDKTLTITIKGKSKRIRRSELGKNISIIREDIIGAMYFTAWCLPENEEEVKANVIESFSRELSRRVAANQVLTNYLKQL